MPTRITRQTQEFRLYLWPGLTLAAMLLVGVPASRAQSGNNSPKSQTIYLPDPTPRETDPHLLLKDNPQVGTSTQEAVEHRNQKRRELVVWAANELVTLSERVQADVKTSTGASKSGAATPDPSLASAAANAEKIEQLAKNLTAALKVP